MKKIFTLMAAFALTLAVNAQKATLGVGGEGTDWVVVSLENDFNCGAFGFKLDLPEGAKLAFDEEEEDYVYERNTERLSGKKWTVDVKETATGYSINIFGSTVKGNEGELIRFKLANPITGTATFKDINFTDVGEDGKGTTSVYMNNDKTTTLPLELKADAIKAISVEETKSGVIYNVAGQRVSKAQKGIFIVDGKKVAVK
jgi:hypothetical protein